MPTPVSLPKKHEALGDTDTSATTATTMAKDDREGGRRVVSPGRPRVEDGERCGDGDGWRRDDNEEARGRIPHHRGSIPGKLDAL